MKSFKVYQSSAGSGKTYTLVREYLQLALKGAVDEYKSILAITFTNKAANEMKVRVLQALRDFSQDRVSAKHAPLFAELLEQTSLSEDNLKARSKAVLTSILHNYADFSISTIDKFSHRIVRTFAHDLKLNVGFDVELEENLLLRRAVDQLIDLTGTREGLTDLLLNFTEQKLDNDGSWQIDRDIVEFSKILLQESDPEKLLRLKDISTTEFFKLRKRLKNKMKELEEPVIQLAKDTLKLIEESGIEPADMAGGTNGVHRYLRYFAEGNYLRYHPTDTVRKNIEEQKYLSAKVSGPAKSALEALSDSLAKVFSFLLNWLNNDYNRLFMYRAVEKSLLQTALLSRVEEQLENVKTELNTIPISDFNKTISNVVSEQPVPFIYERIGERYKHYLIDEFQDTSVMQWQNLLPLINNSLGEGFLNLIVGDAKQAIYGFRGGEVEQFTALPRIYQPRNPEFALEWQQSLSSNFEISQLSSNWRSRKEIVSFNNDFFAFVATKLSAEVGDIYRTSAQEAQGKEGGYVEVDFAYPDQDDFVAYNLNKTLSHISDSLEAGYSFSDITILVETHSNGDHIAEHLIKNNIPVVSAESMKLASSNSVNLLIHLLHLIGEPGHAYHLVKLLEHLNTEGKLKSSVLEVMQQVTSGETTTFEILKGCGIQLNRFFLLSLPVYELVEAVIRATGLSKRSDGYLLSFLDVVLKFSQTHGNDRGEFLEWWQENSEKSSVKVPEGTNAVNILTIHKAKGLEFPVVIHPFADYAPRTSSGKLKWLYSQDEIMSPVESTLISLNASFLSSSLDELFLAEESKAATDTLNRLYVALTRAVDRMYIISRQLKKDSTRLSVAGLLFTYASQFEKFRDNCFKTGVLQDKAEKSQGDQQVLQLDQMVSNDWRDKLSISYRSQQLWSPEELDPRSYGNLIHYMLAEIEYTDQVAEASRKMELKGMLTQEERKTLEMQLNKLLQKKELHKFYQRDRKVKNEAQIVQTEGGGLRPDRLVFNGNQVAVIDYKTGIQQPSHHQQIKAYAEVLSLMGYEVTDGLLVYLSAENEVVQVI